MLRDRIERVAATDFTALIEGGISPQPHPGSIEVFCESSVHYRDGAMEGAGKVATEIIGRCGRARLRLWLR
jgi:prolyl-tRNA editing enzyme YbaK/EbsC (Cys-tRNA(Pro) deacylase)